MHSKLREHRLRNMENMDESPILLFPPLSCRGVLVGDRLRFNGMAIVNITSGRRWRGLFVNTEGEGAPY